MSWNRESRNGRGFGSGLPMMRSLMASICLLTALACALTVWRETAAANGAPATVILTYLPGVSNVGPETATGIAEVIGAEGEITVNVTGLPALNGESYEVWLINTKTKEGFNGGRFNADASQTATYRMLQRGGLPDKHFNLVVLAIAPDGTTSNGPGERRSIGGYYPVPVVDGQQPEELPYTGGEQAAAPRADLSGITVLGQAKQATPQSGPAPYTLVGSGLMVLAAAVVVGLLWGRRRAPARVRRNR